MAVFRVHCPFLYLFGFPCPTCGVTRAIISLLKLDFKGYFFYQPMALPLVICALLMLHISKFKQKKFIYSFVLLVLIVNFILYIAKII